MTLRHIAPNQTEITTAGGDIVLFSYSTPVAAFVAPRWRSGGGYIRTEEKYSATTTDHINEWLGDRFAKIVPQDDINAIA